MVINNFYSKRLLMFFVYILLGISISNLVVVFTNFPPLSSTFHFVISILSLFFSVYLLTRNFFVKYDSLADLIEIEQSSLLADSEKAKSNQKGYIKYRIQDFEIKQSFINTKLTLYYSTSKGKTRVHQIAIPFFAKKHAMQLKQDLLHIVSHA